MLVDPSTLEGPDVYRLMISVVVPRPIAWTSTLSAAGVPNAAPFSYFQALSSRPPMVMIAVGKRRGGANKDTRANIEATGEFVVNVVSEPSAIRMVQTSIDHPPETSEFDEVGLTAVASAKVKPPRIGECAVALECRLDRVLEIGGSGVCIGEVVAFHLRDDIVAADGKTADPWKLRPVGRLGGSNYAPLREVASITQAGEAATVDSEMLAFWRDLRGKTIAMAEAVSPEHLTRAQGGDNVGRMFRHIAACCAYLRLQLVGRQDEDEYKPWDESWTPARLVEELKADAREFEAAIRVFTAEAREMLRLAIRHEAWHQGQIAAVLRNEFGPLALWRV